MNRFTLPTLGAAFFILVLLSFISVPLVWAFDPQPEPPGNESAPAIMQPPQNTNTPASQAGSPVKEKLSPAVQTPHNIKALGPQPEPPDKPQPDGNKLMEPLDKPDSGATSLGPQPEPPDRAIQVK